MFNVTQKTALETAPCWTDRSCQSEAEGGTEFAPVVLLVWTVSLQPCLSGQEQRSHREFL